MSLLQDRQHLQTERKESVHSGSRSKYCSTIRHQYAGRPKLGRRRRNTTNSSAWGHHPQWDRGYTTCPMDTRFNFFGYICTRYVCGISRSFLLNQAPLRLRLEQRTQPLELVSNYQHALHMSASNAGEEDCGPVRALQYKYTHKHPSIHPGIRD